MALEVVKKEISLNVGQPNNFELICAMQGDNKSFEITATLYDVNKLYTINTDNIKLKGVNPLGSNLYKDVKGHTANTVTFALTEDMLAYDGLLKLVLVLAESSTQLTTFPFVIKVVNSPGNTNADDIQTVSALVEEAKKWAMLSKSYAVGTDNEVRKGDAKDNSKYYYEQIKELYDSGKIGNGKILYFETYEEFKKELDAGKIENETLICIKEGDGGEDSGGDGEDNNKKKVYLFNCEDGTNLLGNFIKSYEHHIDGTSSISITSNGITVTANKGAQISAFYKIQHNDFNIDNISQYSKIAFEFEYANGIFTSHSNVGFIKENGNAMILITSLNSENGVVYADFTQPIKNMFMSPSITERFGFNVFVSYNDTSDTVFRIKKIWFE